MPTYSETYSGGNARGLRAVCIAGSLLAGLLSLPASSAAQTGAPVVTDLAQQADFDPERGDVRLTVDRTAYLPGDTARLAAVLTIEPGWHANAHIPSYEGLIGTSLRLDFPSGWTPPEALVYPPGEMKSFSFTDQPISVYEGEVVIRGRFVIPPNVEHGSYPLAGTLTYQACDDRICLRPVDAEVAIPIAIEAGGVPSGDLAFSTASGQAGANREQRGTLWFLLLGFLGGLILNAMPCVLPVLSLKVFGLVKSAGAGRGAVAVGGLATAAGIVLSFWLLAGAAILAREAGVGVGWGIQFQEPAFVGALSVVVLLFTLNLWGLFEIRLPQFLARAGAGAPTEGIAGHLSTGFFATLMATPCSAPFLGTALGFALTRSAEVTFGSFTAIGLGMASPYLALAAFPAATRWLPRPGPWMTVFRAVMGFLLAATLVWLLYVLAALVSAETLAFFELALLGVALLLWLRSRTEGGGARRLAGAAVLVASLAAVVLVARSARAVGAPETLATERLIPWVPFDREQAESEAAAGRYVFVDVTADWCFTCKVNEHLFLETPEVANAFERHGVLAMRADWTRRDESIGEYLNHFGRYGIPFYVMYRPDQEPHVFSELLSKRAILDLLEPARGD